ncbi:MAG: bifunctional folylpolyglutamate synthase/dihydrofolate synthase [Verrucomicrobia bacterium]|nr:bifunctional folylpolyglutamate synthase/dihydrofolate synthase [Verrucomicrobiota bacterium]
MNYEQTIQFLYSLGTFGTKLGLENTVRLAARAGNPQDKLRFIHIAGTNGKGSTCAMLESIYRTAGLRVGLYTSPHLVSFRERIQVDRQWISEGDAVRLVEELRSFLGAFPSDSHPTFFEIVTVVALRYFVEQKCDIVIWETGLGGRLDSTNIVTPLASVITNVQIDHEKWLGKTLREIAHEKSGIIKPGIPMITSESNPEIASLLGDEAKKKNSPVTHVRQSDAERPPISTIQLPLFGKHQLLNAALAVATVRELSEAVPVREESVSAGLLHVQWPGRFQIVRPGVGRTLVLDCAHNLAGAVALRAAIQEEFGSSLITFVIGIMEDKDWKAILQTLVPLAGRILLAPVRSARTADAHMLRHHCQQLNPYAEVLACAGVESALSLVVNDSAVVVTGSIFFVGEAMEVLRLSPTPAMNERRLNDSSSPP